MFSGNTLLATINYSTSNKMDTNTHSLSLYEHQILTLMYNSVLYLIMYTDAHVCWINLCFNILTITLKPKCDTTGQVLYTYSENSISMQNLYHKCSRFQILYEIIHILRLAFVKNFLRVPKSQNRTKLANSYLAQKMALNTINRYTNVWCTEICRYDWKGSTMPSVQFE